MEPHGAIPASGWQEQPKRRRGAEAGPGIIPAPHHHLPNLSTAWSTRPSHANLGDEYWPWSPKGTLMAPATSTGLGLAQARAVDGHPGPPHPKQGTQRHLFPMGQVGATGVGWGAGAGGGVHLPMAGGMQAAASGAGKELGRASHRLGGDELGYGVRLGWKGHR